MLHIETGGSIIPRKEREGNNIKWLLRDMSNGFNRLDQSSSPRWPFPNWSLGLTTCYFTAWEKWWHNLVLVFCLIEGMALSLFILETACSTERNHVRQKRRVFQHSFILREAEGKGPERVGNTDFWLNPSLALLRLTLSCHLLPVRKKQWESDTLHCLHDFWFLNFFYTVFSHNLHN